MKEAHMEVKVHWIIEGVAELEAATMEEAEEKVNAVLRDIVGENPKLVEILGARAVQGKAYLPGSEDDLENASANS
jgi:hypothetical protein